MPSDAVNGPLRAPTLSAALYSSILPRDPLAHPLPICVAVCLSPDCVYEPLLAYPRPSVALPALLLVRSSLFPPPFSGIPPHASALPALAHSLCTQLRCSQRTIVLAAARLSRCSTFTLPASAPSPLLSMCTLARSPSLPCSTPTATIGCSETVLGPPPPLTLPLGMPMGIRADVHIHMHAGMCSDARMYTCVGMCAVM